MIGGPLTTLPGDTSSPSARLRTPRKLWTFNRAFKPADLPGLKRLVRLPGILPLRASAGLGKRYGRFDRADEKWCLQIWYKNGSIDAFKGFCAQNRNKAISIKIVKHPEPVRGILHCCRFEPLDVAGVFILLTDTAIHPAFYPLDEIRSLHYLGSSSLNHQIP